MVRVTSPITWVAMATEAKHINAMPIAKPATPRFSRPAAEGVGYLKA
jgi:hypothetical protein